MKLILTCLTVIILMGVSSVMAIDSDELPFGAYHYEGEYNSTFLHHLDTLCFNYFVEYKTYMNENEIDSLGNHNIMGVRGGIYPSGDAEAPAKYSWANYAAISVRYPYPNPEVRMVGIDSGGFYDNANDSCWVSPQGSIDTLSGFSTYTSEFNDGFMNNRVRFFDKDLLGFPINGKIPYRVKLYAKINDPDPLCDSAVAIINIKLGGETSPCTMYTAASCTLSVRGFQGDTLQAAEIDTFTIPDNIWVRMACDDTFLTLISRGSDYTFSPNLKLEIATTGVRRLAIDKVVIYDEAGKELIENHEYDYACTTQFRQYASRADNIYGWFLMDEPLYANFLPIRYIDSLMHIVEPSWHVYTENCQVNRNWQSLTHSWFKIAGQDYVTPDLYFFGVGQPYSGNDYQDNNGPLDRCNGFHSGVRTDADEEGKNFWMILQAHQSDQFNLRMPTVSELSCQTFMSLSWGARGLNYYFYLWPGYGDGIFDENGNPTVYLDSLKCYDQAGKRLVEDNYYNSLISSLVNAPTWNQVDYWWLRDEPKYDSFRPWGHVKNFSSCRPRLHFSLSTTK